MPGVRCVGAPVVNTLGKVHGAISVAGPAWCLTRERLDLLGLEVADAARRIGAQLKDSLDLVIGLPVPCPTDLAFGGSGLSRLYVTTARQPVSLDVLANAPWSGRLFALDVN